MPFFRHLWGATLLDNGGGGGLALLKTVFQTWGNGEVAIITHNSYIYIRERNIMFMFKDKVIIHTR